MRTSPLLSPAATLDGQATRTETPGQVEPRVAFARALDVIALRLYRAKYAAGTSVTVQQANMAKRTAVLTDGIALVSSADPSWSTRCTDGIDRSPVGILDFIAGCRTDGKAARETLNRMASAAAARNPSA